MKQKKKLFKFRKSEINFYLNFEIRNKFCAAHSMDPCTMLSTTLVGRPTTWVLILLGALLSTTLVGRPTPWVHIFQCTMLSTTLVGRPTRWDLKSNLQALPALFTGRGLTVEYMMILIQLQYYNYSENHIITRYTYRTERGRNADGWRSPFSKVIFSCS